MLAAGENVHERPYIFQQKTHRGKIYARRRQDCPSCPYKNPKELAAARFIFTTGVILQLF